jgi:BirA family transcriptional regulator, biotin operon repressor / biotin---[acetyl-CoA-carboxylase] ligase
MGDLDPEAVLRRLRGRLGRPYTFVAETGSTQLLVPADAEEGTVVAANVQTAGRGRLGRRWEAAGGTSLLFSLALVPQAAPERLPSLTLIAARAVADSLGVASATKYPNDVLVRGRKIAGALGEARGGRVVLGIGVNVNVPAGALPAETVLPPTSLLVETGVQYDRGELLAEILAALERRYDAWLAQG